MARILIIGYGNRLRGDDAIGPMAAERLRELIPDPDIEILALHQLTPELMEPISRAGRIIFIDAAAGANAGEIAERAVNPDPAVRAFTHQATPEALLAGAKALFGAAGPAILFTISAAGFELGEGLSEVAEKALENLLPKIAERVKSGR